MRLCDDSTRTLTLRLSQRRTRGGLVLASTSHERLVELGADGCHRFGFRFWVTGRLAGPGRYVFLLRASDGGSWSAPFSVSHRTRR